MPAKQHHQTGQLWATIRELAARPEGCSTKEVVAAVRVDIQKAGKACNDLRLRGELVVWRLSHRKARYFTTEQLMVAYQGALAKQAAARRKPPKGESPVFPKDAPVIVPEGLVVQVGPRYEPRNTSFEFPFLNQRKAL